MACVTCQNVSEVNVLNNINHQSTALNDAFDSSVSQLESLVPLEVEALHKHILGVEMVF